MTREDPMRTLTGIRIGVSLISGKEFIMGIYCHAHDGFGLWPLLVRSLL